MRHTLFTIGLSGLLLGAGATVRDDRAAIDAALTDFHAAAAEPDSQRYFGHFTDDAIFFGTDASERWTVEEFRAYARPIHESGRGWTYHMRQRHIFMAPGNESAWFDEIVESAHYGRCRGTGVLLKQDGAWKIAQYNLVIPVPNDFADQVVLAARQGVSGPKTIVVVRHAEKEAGDDPGLTDAGRQRVERLRHMLGRFEFDAIYATDFNRTRQTAAPFAAAGGLDVTIYDARDPATLASRLHAGDAATLLVVGHSNTAPDLLRALGVETDLAMDESEYEHLFIVRLDELGRAAMVHMQY